MVVPNFMGRQWVERQEQEPAVWTTEEADESSALLQKRQLGFELTIGGAILSVGLDSNGLPAFTVTAVPPPPPPPPAPTPNPPAPAVAPAPAPTAPAPAPLDTGTANAPAPLDTGTAIVPAALPSSPENTVPAAPGPATNPLLPPSTSALVDPALATGRPTDPSDIIVNTKSGNTVLPTAPLVTPRSSSSTLLRSSITRGTGLQTTTQIIFAGGSAITSVMTLGSAATPESSNSLSPPTIAGAVVGAVGGTAAILLLLVLCVRWRRHIKDNKRKSAGGESIKALHTSPAPMMAHNSARYTNIFPNGGGIVTSDADSGRVAFLPAGAAGFLNRASGSPLHSPGADSPVSHEAGGAQGISNRLLSVPPSPTVPAHYKSGHSGEVAFLAADASSWLNRQSDAPTPQPGPSTEHDAMAGAAGPKKASTQSLSSQAAPEPDNGIVTFLPGTASAFLNQNSNSPLQSDGPPTEHGAATVAAVSNASTRSLPSQTAPAPENEQVTLPPGDTSAFINRITKRQSVGSNNEQNLPPPAPSSSAQSPIPYHTPAPENGKVTFLPADASGFLNRNSTMPLQVGVPYTSTPPPVPSSYNAGPTAAALAVPAAAHMTERDSSDTATNHKLNDNPEWFGSDYRDDRQMPPAAVATAAKRSQSPVLVMEGSCSGSNNEIDEFLAGSSSHTPRDSYDPAQPQNPFESPRFGSPVEPSPGELSNREIAQQDFSHANVQPSPARTPDVRHTPPPISVPDGTYNAPWGPPQASQGRPNWPGTEDESWYQPSSPEIVTGSGNQVMSWPRPPDVDWDRPRVRPRGI